MCQQWILCYLVYCKIEREKHIHKTSYEFILVSVHLLYMYRDMIDIMIVILIQHTKALYVQVHDPSTNTAIYNVVQLHIPVNVHRLQIWVTDQSYRSSLSTREYYKKYSVASTSLHANYPGWKYYGCWHMYCEYKK